MASQIINLEKCPRCGGQHWLLKFKEFKNGEAILAGKKIQYWSLCPETDEPILMNILEVLRSEIENKQIDFNDTLRKE